MEWECLLIICYVLYFVIATPLYIIRGAFVDEKVAVGALDKQGYSDITIIEHQWFFICFRGCDATDAAKFVASAKNPAGKRVEVLVCTGWLFKGATIRTK